MTEAFVRQELTSNDANRLRKWVSLWGRRDGRTKLLDLKYDARTNAEGLPGGGHLVGAFTEIIAAFDRVIGESDAAAAAPITGTT